jgi:hypothetical protein
LSVYISKCGVVKLIQRSPANAGLLAESTKHKIGPKIGRMRRNGRAKNMPDELQYAENRRTCE